jgi:DNA repair protein RecO (recombination protein O)
LEDIAIIGIVLSSMPYREKDKLIHIYSVELGKITAILKGVSAPNSKLKFASQQFCFAKFELTGSKEFYTVKGVELIDSFFDLTSDYDNYTLASSMLEISSIILKPNIIAENMFLCLIKTLQNIVYNNIDSKLAIVKFYISVLDMIGYGLNFTTCDNCGLKFVGDIKFNSETGTFRCIACSGGVKIEKRDFMNLKIISATNIERLNTLKINSDSLKSCIRLLVLNLSERLNAKLKTIDISTFN